MLSDEEGNYLTIKKIQESLKSIQNRFNRCDFDDKSVLRYSTLIMYDDRKKRKRTRKEKESFLQHIINEHTREIVKEYSHVVISKGVYDKYYIQIKGRGDRLYTSQMDIYISKRSGRTLDLVYERAEVFNKIHSEGYTECQVEFPTGNILFANYFKNKAQDDYAFEMPDDLKYKSYYSINHSFGEQATMKMLSQTHGLGYVQLGNTSATVYKIGDDRIIITTAYPYYDDDDGYEHDIPIPSDWEKLGEVCCNVWRVEFIDQANFDKGDALPLDHKEYQYNEPFTGKVNPGIWNIKNRYHFMNDDVYMKKGEIPIWVEIVRQK